MPENRMVIPVYIHFSSSLDVCRNDANIKIDVNPKFLKTFPSVYTISTLVMTSSNALAEDTLFTAADSVCYSRVTSSVFSLSNVE